MSSPLCALGEGRETEIHVQGWSRFEYVCWSADGKGLYQNGSAQLRDAMEQLQRRREGLPPRL
jgi:hypothetical protein